MKNKSIKVFILIVLYLLNFLFACKSNNSILNSNLSQNLSENIESASKFESIYFGRCEQDGNIENGMEDIEWLVIEDTGKDKLLIAKDVLNALSFDDKVDADKKDFNESWEKSWLRTWLNEDFFNSAFNDEEKETIIDSNVKNGKIYGINNGFEPVDMGPDTFDKVYILSKDEIRKYLGFEHEGYSENYRAKPSNFAKAILQLENEKESIAVWHKELDYDKTYDDFAEYWIRSSLGNTQMGAREYFTDIVDKKGHISNYGFPYYVQKFEIKYARKVEESRYYYRGVRPVIRIAGTSKEIIKADDSIITSETNPTIYDVRDIKSANAVYNYDKSKTYNEMDTIVLGSYEQDNNPSNGKEQIEWFVIKKEANRALLMSKYILDYMEYSNVLSKHAVWKDCSLRAWANNEFYNFAFDEKEKVLIVSTKIKNYDNPVYNYISGPETIDKVFLPSFDELMSAFEIDYNDCIKEPYFDSKSINDYRISTTYTDYALYKYRKAKNNIKAEPLSDFWLRNQGRSGEDVNTKTNNAMTARDNIDFKGQAYDYFHYLDMSDRTISTNPKLGYRPCVWIDIDLLDSLSN